MTFKLGPWMFVMLILCVLLWLVSRHGFRMEYYEIRRQLFSHGYVPETNTVNDTPVKPDIQCVGEVPHKAEDLFCMVCKGRLTDFKNPCWYAKEEGKLRLKCVPYYHILGVSKSGTTDLAYRIRAHEDVIGCNDCVGDKESFYWCRRRYGYGIFMDERTPCNFTCFQQMFADAAQKIEQTATETGFHKMITGDATPSDFSDFRGWPKLPQNMGLEKPVSTTPHLMRHVYADPKFILIFRNPTDRLYSDYMMLDGSSVAAFHEAVSRDIEIEETCMKNHTVEQCLYSLDIARKLRTRIFLGCYSVYMREWLKVFTREQFLILRTEDHDHDPKSRLRKVYNYLELNYTEDMLSFVANLPHRRVSQKKIKQGPMLEKTRVLLDNFYSRYKQDLATILQDEKFLWLT